MKGSTIFSTFGVSSLNWSFFVIMSLNFLILLQKQFKRQEIRQSYEHGNNGSSQTFGNAPMNENLSKETSEDLLLISQKSNNDEKRLSVHDRLRKPVSYDDELLGGDLRDDAT